MAIKIVNNNGCVLGTQIINCDEEGAEIGAVMGVEGLSVEFGTINDGVRAKLRMGLVRTEVTANKVEWCVKNPMSGEFAAVEVVRFKSGAVLRFEDDGTPAYYARGEHIRYDIIGKDRPSYLKAPREPK